MLTSRRLRVFDPKRVTRCFGKWLHFIPENITPVLPRPNLFLVGRCPGQPAATCGVGRAGYRVSAGGAPPLGRTAAANLRGRSVHVPELRSRDAHHHLHQGARGDRPDTAPPAGVRQTAVAVAGPRRVARASLGQRRPGSQLQGIVQEINIRNGTAIASVEEPKQLTVHEVGTGLYIQAGS